MYNIAYSNYPPDVDLVAIGVEEDPGAEECEHEDIVDEPTDDPYCRECGEYII